MISITENNFNAIYHRLLRHVYEKHEHVGTARKVIFEESLNLSFELTDPTFNTISSVTRKPNWSYAKAYAEYIKNGGENTDELLRLNPKAGRYLSDKWVKGYVVNYGARIAEQLSDVIEIIKDDPQTRRAVIHILKPEDKFIAMTKHATMEYPCASTIHLLMRNLKMNMIVNMRSQNIAMTIVYDVYNFCNLLLHICNLLQVPPGSYYHNMASAHYYDQEKELVKAILDEHYLPK